jgi:TctA family transporter
MNKAFNRNRVLALILMLVSGTIGWYSLILLTNYCDGLNYPKPNKKQIYGLLFGFIIAIQVWMQKCYTIIPKTK